MNKHKSEFNDLIEQLQAERPSDTQPNPTFVANLRSHLLTQHQQKDAVSPQATRHFSRFTTAATAFALLTIILFLGWFLTNKQPSDAIGSPIQVTRPANETTVDGTHQTWHVTRYLEPTFRWPVTIESWRMPDSPFYRTIMVDEKGVMNSFAQSNGQNYWWGADTSPIYSPNSRTFGWARLDDVQYESTTETELAAPFDMPKYDEFAWGMYAMRIVFTKGACQNYDCLEKLIEPAPIADSPHNPQPAFNSDITSLSRTERLNGRSLRLFTINYTDKSTNTPLPQYRLVKVDADTFEIVQIQDYHGEELLGSIELIENEQVSFAQDFFTVLPAEAQAVIEHDAFIRFENDIQFSRYAIAQPGSTIFISLDWQAPDHIDSNAYRGLIQILDENNNIVAEHTKNLSWGQFTSNWILANLDYQPAWLPNGHYQVQIGIIDQETGNMLSSNQGDTTVPVDTFVIENGLIAGLPIMRLGTGPAITQVSNRGVYQKDAQAKFGDNLELTYHHFLYTSNNPDSHSLKLLWEARTEPTESLAAFIFVYNEAGRLVQQQDDVISWAETAEKMKREGFTMNFLQTVKLALPDGRYEVHAGLYNSETGARLMTDNGETAVYIDLSTLTANDGND